MVIDQRNAGASVTATGFNYTVDRWFADVSVTSKFTVQQNAGSVTPPAGFTNYLGVTSTATTSLAAGDYYTIGQIIEGFNAADLDYGKSTAKTITVSFWVRSSLTGTFGGVLRNGNGTLGYPFTYTISVSNTWEQKSITVAGPTTGTWLTTNGNGLGLQFGLGVGTTYSTTAGSWQAGNFLGATGAVSVVGTNGATFYITGVQLEKGSTATSFDYRPYGTELALCQRYFISYGGTANYERMGGGSTSTTTVAYPAIAFPVEMRTGPSVGYSSLANLALYTGSAVNTITALAIDQAATKVTTLNATVASGLTIGQFVQILANNTSSARLTFSAEL